MKKRLLYLPLLLCLLFFTACGQAGNENIPAIETFPLTPSREGTETVTALIEKLPAGYEEDTCFNVTPESISEKYGFTIYKYDSSCASFLMYEEAVYPLGEWFGGYGATSFAVADMNGDGEKEVYFTFSWGSGIHRSQIGYFDTADKTVTVFDYSDYTGDMVLKTDGKSSLYACHAVCDASSFVDIQLTGETKAASIVCESGLISLAPEEASSSTEG